MPIIENVSYHKRQDTGTWRVIYYHIQGARKQRKFKSGFSTRARAEKWLRDYTRQLESGELDTERLTYSDLKKRYLESRHHKRESSIANDRAVLENFETHIGTHTMSDEITDSHISAFLAKRKPTVSQSTLSRDLRTLHTLFAQAVTWRIITQNPAGKITKIEVDESEIVYLDTDAQKRVYAAAEAVANDRHRNAPYIFPLVVIALRTGMRKGEILHLRRKNIDIARRRIRIENDPDSGWKTKTGKSRIVPIDEMVIDAFAWWDRYLTAEVERSAEIARITGNRQTREKAEGRLLTLTRCQASPYVFPSFADPAKPMGQFDKAWDAVREAAKIDNRFHDLRHTYAVMCAFAGVPVLLLSKLLGHANIKTTMRYLRFYDEDAAARVELPDFR